MKIMLFVPLLCFRLMSRVGACNEAKAEGIRKEGRDKTRFKMMFYMKIFISLLSFLHSLPLDVHRFFFFFTFCCAESARVGWL